MLTSFNICDYKGGRGSWYSATVATSNQEKYQGANSLRVDVTDPWGWALPLGNWPGFETGAGDKRISYWAKQGSGTIGSVTLDVSWIDGNQQTLRTDAVTLENLSGSWQQKLTQLTVPTGTQAVNVVLSSEEGVATDSIYLDHLVIADI